MPNRRVKMRAVLAILFSVSATATTGVTASFSQSGTTADRPDEATSTSTTILAEADQQQSEQQQLHYRDHHHQQQQEQDPEDHQHRSLAVYAIYNLNPFAVTFTTLSTEELIAAYSSALLNGSTSLSSATTLVSATGSEDSSLSYPLREVTQQFIQQGFQSTINDWRTSTLLSSGGDSDSIGSGSGGQTTIVGTNNDDLSSASTSTTSTTTATSTASILSSKHEFNNMYNRLVTVDLRVQMYVRNDVDGPLLLGQSRQLRSNRSNDAGGRRSLQQQAGSSTSTVGDSGVITTQRKRAHMIAEVYPTVAFTEPLDATSKPSNTEIQIVFGDIMLKDLLTDESRDVYLRELVQSSQELLQEITDLNIQLDIRNTNGVSSATSDGGGSGWSGAIQILVLSLLVVLSVVAFGVGLLLVRQRRVHKAKQQRLMRANLDPSQSRDEYYDEYYDDPIAKRRTAAVHGSTTRRQNSAVVEGGDGGSLAENSFVSAFSTLSGTVTGGIGRIFRGDNQYHQRLSPGSFPTLSSSASVQHPRRPPPIGVLDRSQSLDAHRHGTDIFPVRRTTFQEANEANARSVLEASDRYLSRHRPDLYYDDAYQHTVSVFGRSYEIPSNPFDFIYRGFQSNDQQRQQQQQSTTPFGSSPGGAFFTPTVVNSTGGGSNSGGRLQRATSFSEGPSPRNSFTPILQPNISAKAAKAAVRAELEGGEGLIGGGAEPSTPQGAHTGNESLFHRSHSYQGTIGSSIWRNLSMSSWYGGGGSSRGGDDAEEFVDYDDRDPTLFNSEIELEDLPPGAGMMLAEDDPADYDFPFQDFPRRDGTPCLIYNEDALLQEREARQRTIFVIGGDGSESSEEKKSMDQLDSTKPVSDEAFMNMLSQNSQKIDGDELSYAVDIDVESDGGEADSVDIFYGKSKYFQEQLAHLIESKQRRYAMECKKEDIMNNHRKNRKETRELERRNRHKELEREIEDIEAEFFSPADGVGRISKLTMSPMRKDYPSHGSHSPVNPSSRHDMRAASPVVALSPYRNNAHSVRHRRSGSNSSIKSSTSPVPPSRQHRRTSSNASIGRRAPSPGPRHRRTDSNASAASTSSNGKGGDVFRPRTSYAGSLKIHASSSMGAAVPDGAFPIRRETELLDESNMHPVALFGEADETTLSVLSMPTMGTGSGKDDKAKYPSPQSVIDEIMNGGTGSSGHHQTKPHYAFHRPSAGSTYQQHRRPRSPTKSTSLNPALSGSHHRRGSSLDVHDTYYRASSPQRSTYTTIDGGRHHQPYAKNVTRTAVSPVVGRRSHNEVAASGEGGGRRRSSSVSSSNGRNRQRGNSNHQDDIFLHGVVAQTRFI